MISYIKGTLAMVQGESVVLDNQGIGYHIRMPLSMTDMLPEYGEEVMLYTYLHIREDAMQLFGFLYQEDLEMFKLLLGVSGIGPKVPLEISKYINDNLSAPLMLDNIADRFYLSKNHINRIFKAQVGTTVRNYIKLKRLYLAKELISNGNRPTDVYSKCGYNDYTTFFRAYKKQFDHSPTTLFHSNISP